LRTSKAITAQDSRVDIRGSSSVGRRGAVLTSVPKKIVPESASNEGVHQTELVAGPKEKVCLPRASSIVIGGSRCSGFGPTSYFQRPLPVSGSGSGTKSRPVQPL